MRCLRRTQGLTAKTDEWVANSASIAQHSLQEVTQAAEKQ